MIPQDFPHQHSFLDSDPLWSSCMFAAVPSLFSVFHSWCKCYFETKQPHAKVCQTNIFVDLLDLDKAGVTALLLSCMACLGQGSSALACCEVFDEPLCWCTQTIHWALCLAGCRPEGITAAFKTDIILFCKDQNMDRHTSIYISMQ